VVASNNGEKPGRVMIVEMTSQAGRTLPPFFFLGLTTVLVRLSQGLFLALVVQHVTVPRCRPCELGAAVGTTRFCRLPRLFALVSEKVAECRELAAVASMLPALRLGPAVHYSDLPFLWAQGWRYRIHAKIRVWCD
jgi:hypothetical protein